MGEAATLDPDRARASSPLELVEAVARSAAGAPDPDRLRALAAGLAEVIGALAASFPDNIFWDLDHVAACLWHAGGPAPTRSLARRVARLCEKFGLRSELRFRYAHDMIYGYDWARWVSREPAGRQAIGPFDPPFLDYLEQRREELLQLIASGDAKYHALASGAFRNPFGFGREPHEEARLHRELAREDLIPVKAWRLDGERRWRPPFTELRTQTARRLGLSPPGQK
ncbi:MAG: ferrochelatase [Myxococcales bacterium]|nr:MAG: ferrochelatase [Myxococcales bacterium]